MFRSLRGARGVPGAVDARGFFGALVVVGAGAPGMVLTSVAEAAWLS